VTVLPEDGELPTKAHPMQALVLVPSGTSGTTTPAGSGTGTVAQPPTWVFPFDRPLPPGEGDNQAMAVNTDDGSVTYDVAMAMVWVQDGEQDAVDNTNEAYAFASCQDCVTVAVAFQVVVIVGQADVVVPKNVSAAVNYDCFECITAAIAKQLVVTVDTLPGEDQVVALSDIWADLAKFAATIPTLSLDELLTKLEEFEEQIKQVLTGAVEQAPPAPAPSQTSSAAPSQDPSATPADDPSTPATTESSDPTPTESATPTEEPSAAETTPVAEESPTS
jgi:putative peptide zinc metalloprotease protein